MQEKELKSIRRESEPAPLGAQEQYSAPQIGITDIELTQNILGNSAEVPDMPGEEW